MRSAMLKFKEAERLINQVSANKQEIIFVTGKGGVGKSAVAAAVAVKRAQQGKRTLLVELGYQSFYKDYLEQPEVGYHPRKMRENLDIALWSGPECLQEYVLHLLKIESLYKLFFENQVTKALVNVAPALPELSIIGKVTSGLRKVGPPVPYDCIVVDAFASGHFMALIKAPSGMGQAVRFGPMGEQSRSMEKILQDSEYCKYLVVSLPEDLPVQEALELSEGIKQVTNVEPIQILNRNLSVPEDISGQGDFVDYLQNCKQRQQDAEQKLQQRANRLSKLPFVLSMKPSDVVTQLAEQIEV